MSNGLVIKNNLSALSTLNTMNSNTTALNASMKKVSSGMRINSAADDASGYQISERMRVQIKSLDQANRNTQNGNSLLKTAEGAVSSTVEIIKTLKEKVLNAANGTNTESDLEAIQSELDQSIEQINDNANVTYNGKYLVDGSLNKQIDNAVKNAFTNNSLAASTAATTDLTALSDRNGNSVGIVSGDKITLSFVVNGKTTVVSAMVGKTSAAGQINKLSEIFATDKMTGAGNSELSKISFGTSNANTSLIGTDSSGYKVYTADGSCVITVTAANGGITNSISGFSIGVTDKNGNVKTDINKIMDNFSEKIQAEDVSNDNRLVLQTGTKSNQTIAVALKDMGSQALGLQGLTTAGKVNLNVTTAANATAAVNVLDNALQKALGQQTTIGAIESRLSYTGDNLTTASENVTNSESTVRDADMAAEMTNYQKNNVLKQASQAMLAQANQSGSAVLSLLQ